MPSASFQNRRIDAKTRHIAGKIDGILIRAQQIDKAEFEGLPSRHYPAVSVSPDVLGIQAPPLGYGFDELVVTVHDDAIDERLFLIGPSFWRWNRYP